MNVTLVEPTRRRSMVTPWPLAHEAPLVSTPARHVVATAVPLGVRLALGAPLETLHEESVVLGIEKPETIFVPLGVLIAPSGRVGVHAALKAEPRATAALNIRSNESRALIHPVDHTGVRQDADRSPTRRRAPSQIRSRVNKRSDQDILKVLPTRRRQQDAPVTLIEHNRAPGCHARRSHNLVRALRRRRIQESSQVVRPALQAVRVSASESVRGGNGHVAHAHFALDFCGNRIHSA
mmetsp:Transcript_21725/g.76277  ORF Transcript_21725/g.76277 Transcript_21725/m.76277 type:complete len:237 (-) Transcript_21725:2795-3505(-)